MASQVVIGRNLAIQICDAVSIPIEGVMLVSIDLRPDCIASVTVVRAIDEDEAGKIIETLQRYELHECEQKAE